MKKTILYSTLAAAFVLASCSDKNDGELEMISAVEAIPAVVAGSNAWSLVTPKGEVLCENMFQAIPSAVINGVFTVGDSNGITVYRIDGKRSCPIDSLHGLEAAGGYCEGLIGIVYPNQRISFADKKGEIKFVLNPVDGHEIVACGPAFADGLLWVLNDEDKFGYVDTEGKMVISPTYDGATYFNGGYAMAFTKADNGDADIFIINKQGEKTPFPKDAYPQQEYFRYGRMPVMTEVDGNRQYGYVTTDGEFHKFPSQVEWLGNYNADYFLYGTAERKVGAMKFSDDYKVVVEPTYSGLAIVDGGKHFFGIAEGGNSVLLNAKGEVEMNYSGADIYPLDYYYPSFNAMIERLDNHQMLMGYDGKQLGDAKFETIQGVSLPNSLHSAYFDVDGFAAYLVGMLDDKGLKGYPIKSQIRDYLGGTCGKQYYRTFMFKPENADITNNYGDIEREISTDYAVAMEFVDGSNEDLCTVAEGTEVDGCNIFFHAKNKAQWAKHSAAVEAKIISMLEAKGFNRKSHLYNRNMFGCENYSLMIIVTSDGLDIYVRKNMSSDYDPATEESEKISNEMMRALFISLFV